MTLGQPPLRKVRVEASVAWDQYGRGSVDLRDTLLDAAIAQGSSRNRQIASYTGAGLIEDWPEKGDRIGGGWAVGESRATRTDGPRGPFTFRFQEISFLNSTRYNFPLVTIDPVFSVDYLVSLKLVQESAAPVLKEIRLHNPLLFDFVLKRHLRSSGKALSRAVFETRRFFASL